MYEPFFAQSVASRARVSDQQGGHHTLARKAWTLPGRDAQVACTPTRISRAFSCQSWPPSRAASRSRVPASHEEFWAETRDTLTVWCWRLRRSAATPAGFSRDSSVYRVSRERVKGLWRCGRDSGGARGRAGRRRRRAALRQARRPEPALVRGSCERGTSSSEFFLRFLLFFFSSFFSLSFFFAFFFSFSFVSLLFSSSFFSPRLVSPSLARVCVSRAAERGLSKRRVSLE